MSDCSTNRSKYELDIFLVRLRGGSHELEELINVKGNVGPGECYILQYTYKGHVLMRIGEGS